MTDDERASNSVDSGRRVRFGIYPGGPAGSATGLASGKPDEPERVAEALCELEEGANPLIVRTYAHFAGKNPPETIAESSHPHVFHQYAHDSRKLDLVLTFGDKAGKVEHWSDFVCEVVRTRGPLLSKIQIGEEVNLQMPPGDGQYPRVAEAVVAGVIAARQEIKRCGYDVQVGFNAVPRFERSKAFWADLSEVITDEFRASLDYVGIDVFQDVFRPLEDVTVDEALLYNVSMLRKQDLRSCGIEDSVPVHITEIGWPTGPERSEERQAEVLESTARTIARHSQDLNVTCYEWFSLRDADSSKDDIFFRFGLLRDDYSRKPAFYAFKQVIQELGC